MNEKVSMTETKAHILRVRELLYIFQNKLEERGFKHDLSKLASPEKEGFDKVTNILHGLTYGSDEYKIQLKKLEPILKHHYANNSHHPEHYTNGVNGMSLLDIIEMFCDWKAATERHENGNLEKSIQYNKNRFNLSDQLVNIFENTQKEMKW